MSTLLEFMYWYLVAFGLHDWLIKMAARPPHWPTELPKAWVVR